MKKFLMVATAIGTLACVGNANAAQLDIKPYVGMDYVYSHFDFKDSDTGLEKTYHAGAVNVGAKFHKNFGAEIYYLMSGKENKTNGFFERDFKYQMGGIDAIGYLPVTNDGKVELLGSAGVGWFKYDSEARLRNMRFEDNGSDIAYRVGAGVQYNINDNWALRTMAHYTWVDNKGIDSFTDVSAGVRYSF